MVEGLLPDSQCGFQKGQGCVDMIFVARELMERQGNMGTLFFMFKEFCVRDALQRVLAK